MIISKESRDIVFEVTLVSPSTLRDDAYGIPHALVQLTYYDTISSAQVGPITLTAHISRPNDNEVSWRNPSVTCQLLRVRTVDAIMRAKKEESKESSFLMFRRMLLPVHEFLHFCFCGKPG